MLKQLIDNRIDFQDSVSSWEDAIILGAKPLLEQGFLEQKYIDTMIANVHEFGPYIVLTDGVAMPHTRPENGALKTGMSFLKLENGVLFPDTEEPVTALFTLVAKDNDAHISAMMELADILGEESTLDNLFSVSTKEKFLEILS